MYNKAVLKAYAVTKVTAIKLGRYSILNRVFFFFFLNHKRTHGGV